MSVAVGTVACKKQAATMGQPKTVEEGVEQLRPILATAGPEVQSNLYSGVVYNVRYGKLMDAMMYLDKISSDPSLNEQQKKAVGQVLDLFKQSVQNQPH